MFSGEELGKAFLRAYELKKAAGAVKSKTEVARHFGIKAPSIHDWIKKGSIGKEKLPILWEYFSDVVGPAHWGLSDWPAPVGVNLARPQITCRMVPLISWMQAGEFCCSSAITAPEDAPLYACPNAQAGPCTYALEVRGESMTNPFGGRSYPEGVIIFIDPERAAQAKPGDRVIAVLADGGTTFKELAQNTMGQLFLRALNPRYTINEHEQPAQICGVVIGSYMPE
ncbi:MAG: LexA family protein [Aeromonas sp.]